jgi:FkbM family methyltransferase
MTIFRQLVTANKGVVTINSDDEQLIKHFNNPANYADVVLDMFNNDRFYDIFFEGWNDITVLDIGGNIGLFSLYIQDIAKDVYTIEPTPSHFQLLSLLTKDYKNIHPINAALHNKNEPIDFYISSENSTMNSSVNKYGQKVAVTGTTLANLINQLALTKVDFVKCDIEGSEMQALTYETVNEVKDIVSVWSVEVHATDTTLLPEISLNRNRDNLMQIFSQNGYNTIKHRYDALYAYKG